MLKKKRFLKKGCACALICALALSGCANSSSSDTTEEAETTTEAVSSLDESAEEPESMAEDGSLPENGSMPEGESMPEAGSMPEGETPPDGESMGEGGTPPDGESMAEGKTPPDGEGGGNGGPGGEGGGQGGSGSEGGSTQAEQPESYDAVTEYSEDTTVESESYSSTGTDENAILISSGTVTLSNITVDRTSSDSTGGDSSSFYGVGAAILATDGILNVLNSVITTDASGGAGIFSYGSSVVNVEDTTINTTQDTSGGIHVAGGGTLTASNLTVSTAGASAAAIRSDRGGGTMTVDGGTYTSSGTGSPAVYCTADITVSDATLTATGSEALCMEGLNYLSLTDCDITGNMSDDDQNDTTWNVIVYQSMSGDSEEGVSTLRISGGTLTANNGGMIYTTNTEADILLSDVDITAADDAEFFLQCTGNNNERGWGSAGSNGSDCTFTAIDQEMPGDVIWDSVSELDFYMTDGSTLTGAVIQDESWAGDGGDGYCSLYISEDSTWIVTGDSTLTTLACEGTIVDADGNTVSIVGSDNTSYVSGSSSYTITVDSYETTVDLSGASAL